MDGEHVHNSMRVNMQQTHSWHLIKCPRCTSAPFALRLLFMLRWQLQVKTLLRAEGGRLVSIQVAREPKCHWPESSRLIEAILSS